MVPSEIRRSDPEQSPNNLWLDCSTECSKFQFCYLCLKFLGLASCLVFDLKDKIAKLKQMKKEKKKNDRRLIWYI